MIEIDSLKAYNLVRERGYEPLTDARFHIKEPAKKEIVQEIFGRGNSKAQNQKFYRFMWAHKAHYCEECGIYLQHYAATYVSHIMARGAYPEFAYYPDNVNILCYRHHNQWENPTTRKSMGIYEKNMETIERIKREYRGDEEVVD